MAVFDQLVTGSKLDTLFMASPSALTNLVFGQIAFIANWQNTSITWGPSAVLRPAGHYWLGWGAPWHRPHGRTLTQRWRELEKERAGRARGPAGSLDGSGP